MIAANVPISVTPSAELENRPFGKDGGSVVYLEPDGRSGLRVFREEKWVRRAAIRKDVPVSVPKVVRGIYPYFKVERERNFVYDSVGRITAVTSVDADGNAETQFCALYDAAGRVEVATSTDNHTVSLGRDFECSELRNGPSLSATEYFQYRGDGVLERKLSKSLVPARREANPEETQSADAADDGAWQGYGELYYVNRGNGVGYDSLVFQMSDARGVTQLHGSNFGIVPSDATPLFEQRSKDGSRELSYTFTRERVPPEVMEGLLVGLTRYTRVRGYEHQSGQKIFEIFSPGAKHPRERQWRTLDLNRQENYDAKGKLTRVILSGPVSGDAYTENLRAYAEKGFLKLTPLTSGYSSYRVYDYDAAGKETLSFVCWRYEVSTNKPYAHFPWWEPDPRPKRSREAELQYGRTQVGTRCGTPDGKMVVEGMGPVKKLMETKYGFGTTKLGLPGE